MRVFLFKQKPAYDLRISDWSSDVCSSDLRPSPGRGRPVRVSTGPRAHVGPGAAGRVPGHPGPGGPGGHRRRRTRPLTRATGPPAPDRKSVVERTRVSVPVDLGGRGIVYNNITTRQELSHTPKTQK